jgi:hypothetical protein
MRPKFAAICMAGLLCLGTVTAMQCNVQPPPASNNVTIRYINSTDEAILVDLLTSNDPNISQDDLLAGGTLFSDTVAENDTIEFELACAGSQALIIDQAVMLIQDGPRVGSTILYEDLDYACGQVVAFEFQTNADKSELYIYLVSP